jgi:hypothetical protein
MDSNTPPAIDSLSTWQAALLWGMATAQAEGARTIICVDPSFEFWPLGDTDLLTGLGHFLRLPGRRLVLLAASFDDMRRLQPHFTEWRRDWTHAMQCVQAPQELATELPSVLLDDRRVSVRLVDPVHWRGRAQQDGRARWLLQEQIDVVLQRSEPAFAVTTLGL